MTENGKPRHRADWLARAAKVFSLAVVVFVLVSLREIFVDGVMNPDAHRSAMGFAYLAAASIVIAFDSPGPTLQHDLTRGAGLLTAGIVVALLLAIALTPFDILCAAVGILYAVMVRRAGPF